MKRTLLRCLLFIGLMPLQDVLIAQDFNILDFGAQADGKTLCTDAIQAAIDAASDNGGGRVVVPAGHFVTGRIVLKSDVDLHITEDATLFGSTDVSHYVSINRWKALVMADGQQNIAITGRGQIDGQGRALALHIDSLFRIGQLKRAHYNFVEMRPKEYMRPQLIEFVNCRNVLVKNVTLKNSACWVQQYDRCENIVIDSITVDSDAYWNNDGIDIGDCRNVRITNSSINSADDGICLKSHWRDHYCDSIYVANCTIRSSASAIKFGTMSHGGFRNVRIENINIYDTYRSAIAIESVDGGFLENVHVEGIHAVNTGNAIFIRLGRRNKGAPVGSLKNITLKDIAVEVPFGRPDSAYEIRGPALPFFHNTFPSSITGIPGHPVENVTLENIEIRYPGRGNKGLAYMPLSWLDEVPENVSAYPEFSMFGELPVWGLYVRHVKGLALKNINLYIEDPDYRPAIVLDDVRNADLQRIGVYGDSKREQVILHNTEMVRVDRSPGVIRMRE